MRNQKNINNQTNEKGKKRFGSKTLFSLVATGFLITGVGFVANSLGDYFQTVEAEVKQDVVKEEKENNSTVVDTGVNEEVKEGEKNSSDIYFAKLTDKSQPEITKEQAVKFLERFEKKWNLTCSAKELVEAYIKAGEKEGIRWDFALTQGAVETAYFKSTQAKQNNFCGTRDEEGSLITFDSVEEGVMAQVQLVKKVIERGGDWAIAPGYSDLVLDVLERVNRQLP